MSLQEIAINKTKEGAKIKFTNLKEKEIVSNFFKVLGFEWDEWYIENWNGFPNGYIGFNGNTLAAWSVPSYDSDLDGSDLYDSVDEFLFSLFTPSFKRIEINSDYYVELYKDRFIVRGPDYVHTKTL